MDIKYILFIITIVIFLLIVVNNKQVKAGLQDLDKCSIEVKFKVLLDELNNRYLDNSGKIEVGEGEHRYKVMLNDDNKPNYILLQYVKKKLTILLFNNNNKVISKVKILNAFDSLTNEKQHEVIDEVLNSFDNHKNARITLS